MPNFSKYFMTSDQIDTGARAVSAWNRIQRDRTSVVLVRAGVDQTAQVVRVEMSSTPSARDSDAGHGDMLRVVVYGVQGHPSELVPDTDIQAGDRFSINGIIYTVERVVDVPGEVQAMCESV